MRPAELLLRAICSSGGVLTLVLPRSPGRGPTMRLFGRYGGPACEVLCCASGNQTTVQVDAKKVADWLADRDLAWTRRDGDRISTCDDLGEIEIEVVVDSCHEPQLNMAPACKVVGWRSHGEPGEEALEVSEP